VSEAHPVAHSWPEHLGVGGAIHFARHAYLSFDQLFSSDWVTHPSLPGEIRRQVLHRDRAPATLHVTVLARIALLCPQVCRGDTQAQPFDQMTRRYSSLQSDNGCQPGSVDLPYSPPAKKLRIGRCSKLSLQAQKKSLPEPCSLLPNRIVNANQ